MLKQRILTALALLAVLLPTLFTTSPEPFVLFAACMVGAAAWEWGRLGGVSARTSVLNAVFLSVGLLVLWGITDGVFPSMMWMLPALAWVVGGAYLLRTGVAGWSEMPRLYRLGLGYAVLMFAWMAMASARMQGVNLLLSIMFLVWAADVFAFFGGRAFGRKKLAPTISPGKSWAGVYSGAIGVLVVGVIWLNVDALFAVDSQSMYTILFQRFGWMGLIPLGALVALSVMGDLIESLVKRSAGVKDSSQLLPGHGGVLDRIDALLPVLPVAMLFVG